MNIILLLIPISLVLLALGVWAFFWAVNHAQFDDLDTPSLSPLAEDESLPRARAPAEGESLAQSVRLTESESMAPTRSPLAGVESLAPAQPLDEGEAPPPQDDEPA